MLLFRARGILLVAARAPCRPSRSDFRVGTNALVGVGLLGCRVFRRIAARRWRANTNSEIVSFLFA